jgi:TetR/AcrR family transcriptional regulator, lmrAB and yxaGH operons repressor
MKTAREQIIQTTCTLIESQGYHATGLNQIIKESGSPKGSLYYYFPEGKEALADEALRSVTSQVVDRIRENLAAFPEPAQAVRTFTDTIAHFVETSDFEAGGPLTTVALETATTNERLNQVCRESYEAMRMAFEDHLLDGGLAAAQASHLSGVILAAIEGAVLLSRTYHTGDPLREMGKALEVLIKNYSQA